VDPDVLEGYASLGELRTQELLCAAVHLGLTGVHFLDYADSGMEDSPENLNPASLNQAPLEEVAEKLTRLIRLIRPQVVLTHDPSGGYFHPDHIKVHQATVEAFQSAGDAGRFPEQLEEGLVPFQAQKLYYTAFPRGMLRLVARMLPLLGQDPEAFGRNGDINVKRIADVEQVVTTKIAISRYREASQQAARCHASQTGGSSGRVTGLLARLVRSDTFSRAVPPFEDGGVERDLFAGIGEV
jgi:LmbE family N-acetylglucosaminyl deacetylase